MGVDGGQALQGQYTAKWLKLKLTLTAKYFSDKDLAGSRACMRGPEPLHALCAFSRPPQSAQASLPCPQAASTTRRYQPLEWMCAWRTNRR